MENKLDITEEKLLGNVIFNTIDNRVKVETLVELLIEKGLLSKEEYEKRLKVNMKEKTISHVEELFEAPWEEVENMIKEK